MGESPEEAAKRELKEEVGIKDCEIVTKKAFQSLYKFRLLGIYPISKRVDFFIGKTQVKSTKPDKKEIKRTQWLQYSQAYNLLTHQSSKFVLKEANAYLNSK